MFDNKALAFIGDSLTEYFDWQTRFPAYRVMNFGNAGETLEGLHGRMDRIILSLHNPDVIFLMSGINNIAMEDLDVAGIYKQIINKFVSVFERTELVVQSLLPVELSWVDNGDIRKINNYLREIALNHGARYLDVHSLFLDTTGKPDSACLLGDGVHLSEKGYKVWSQAVEDFLMVSK